MWTPAAVASEARAYQGEIWRVVEAQARVSTLRITDSLEEQAILEEEIEATKPVWPPDCARLHYLLATPFRYAPYPHGSRFRRARQREGVFYASEHVETAIAETAFYRLLFFAESPTAKLPANPVEHTAFAVACATPRAIDLTRPPLDADASLWEAPVAYGPCQDLADAARAAAIEALRYRSVRDSEGRANVGLLSPRAFAAAEPRATQTWRLFPRAEVVQAWREFPQTAHEFRRADFARDSRLRPPGTPA